LPIGSPLFNFPQTIPGEQIGDPGLPAPITRQLASEPMWTLLAGMSRPTLFHAHRHPDAGSIARLLERKAFTFNGHPKLKPGLRSWARSHLSMLAQQNSQPVLKVLAMIPYLRRWASLARFPSLSLLPGQVRETT
jgi:hypothetical protein